ncbi:hypothetical protein [Cryptosporangium aurantiacum]|uniref:Uncharacterized protein n=1 Tax=Cryptosporangium aurantiacum TaxID=134849 RepID=A0A1M7RDW6_9ACTN|nr:hypothetical protein [Cryptosporangium aurantiacum]SHN44339.1 hypothetical protein SAMN05443668_110168 [Cryptosporangium aurantiacum]
MNENVVGQLQDLRAAPDEPYQGLGSAAARVRAAERRRHQRGAAVAAILVLVIAAVGVVLGFRRDTTDRLQPVTPPPNQGATYHNEIPPTKSPEPGSPTTSLGQIDWANSVMDLPPNEMCPHRRVQFTDGKASLGHWQYSIVRFGPPLYGDFDRDGFTDAVAIIECHGDDDVGGPESRFLIAAFAGNAKGGPTPIGVVDAMQAYIDPVLSSRHQGSTIVIDYRPAHDMPQVWAYRWNGTKFIRSN